MANREPVPPEELARLRAKYSGDNVGVIHQPEFARVASRVIDPSGTRSAPFAGLTSLLSAPTRRIDWSAPDFAGLQVALLGVPMDLGVSNRNGSRFGPRALRTIERIGPYNPNLDCIPTVDLAVADVGDVPFRSRFSLETAHEDITRAVAAIVAAGVAPLSVGGDHSISLPILRAVAADGPVCLVHIDAHCDTGGAFDGERFHHGGPFRHAVLEGLIDPAHTIQIGIRGSSEYLWEFSVDSGMTVIHAEEIGGLGIPAVIETVRSLVGNRPVYLSYDIDSLDPAFAPGTGTPEIGGLTTREALELVRGFRGLNLVGGDLVEVAPQYDATTNTAHAGAQLLFEILSLMVFSPSIGARAG
ncbi:agmatinase [Pseudoxanthobacter sp.]|uniref:agmatinase n=1 Tax=Pseudoxanthobacter sp. TaxID=1925742 RepID=UPI002FE1A843